VVDVHRFTVSPDHGFGRLAAERGIARELGEYYEQVEQALPNVVRLLDACRTSGLPVIFTRLVADDGHGPTPQARVTGFWTAAGSSEAEFVPGLQPHTGDVVINKTATSGFASGRLDALLRARDIEHLVVCGVLTNGAVEHTVRDAADRGYGVIVVSDACAGESWTIGAFVMTTLVGGLIRTRSTQAVLEMLNGTRT
jgi:nicotinamidase-related amidase